MSLVEAAVGAHLLAHARLNRSEVHYRRTRHRGRDLEVDYVVLGGAGPLAIEVKSGQSVGSLEGLTAFREAFGAGAQTLIAGTGGIPLEEFLAREPRLLGTAATMGEGTQPRLGR